uniref:Rna-directed dna polymerase from mobile element jockey-like protein n=1 Tax=Triatoma infestans TaxID=30076 RepID=A0A161M212_TRIIF
MWELEWPLSKSKDTCPGTDSVHYMFLKHLNRKNKLYLLRFYNKIWNSRQFPKPGERQSPSRF